MRQKYALFLCAASVLFIAGNSESSAAQFSIAPQTAVAPTITSQPVSTSVKVSAHATFSVAVTGTAPFSYQWYKYGSPIAGATHPSYITPPTTDADNGANFYVIVKNSVTSVMSNYAYLTVGDPPVIASQPSSVAVTMPNFAFFSVSAYGTGPLSYQWYKKGVLIPGANSDIFPTGELTLADNGATYFAIVKNAFGAATSKTAVLTVKSSAATTLPIVGYWSGTATTTRPGHSSTTHPVAVAISQNSFSLIMSFIFVDAKGASHYRTQVISLNGQNLYAVRSTTVNNSPGMLSIAGGFTSDLLTLNVVGGAQTNIPTMDDGALTSGTMTMSSDHQTLTGKATSSVGSITFQLTREQ